MWGEAAVISVAQAASQERMPCQPEAVDAQRCY